MGRTVRATIRETAITGDYPVPTSEQDYLAHTALIDTVMPLGGALQPDGTWIEIADPSDFSLSLPGWARASGQRYVPRLDPGHGTDGTTLKAVLDDSGLQEDAADNAVELALIGLGAPWGGVLYDVLDVPEEYIEKQNDFIALLASHVRAAGFSFEVDYHGVRYEDESMFMSLDVIAAAADMFDYYMFGWWLAPCSTGPYWWARASLDNALEHGIESGNIYLGIANFARYWPLPDYSVSHDLTYDQAMQMVRDSGATVEWIESHETGLVREKYAAVGDGRLWIQDGDTVRPRLDLVDEYGLGGIMLFILGMGHESVWSAIDDWKNPAPVPLKRPKVGNVNSGPYGANGLFSNLEVR